VISGGHICWALLMAASFSLGSDDPVTVCVCAYKQDSVPAANEALNIY